MEYKIIFTTGYDDDIDSIGRQLKWDVLILDGNGNYFNPQFITNERIRAEFIKEKSCYPIECMVILHSITKETILKSIYDLHKWQLQRRWIPLTDYQVKEYFYPESDWVTFIVNVE